MQVFVNIKRKCFFLSMKSSFERRLQADDRHTSKTENISSSYYEQSKFDDLCAATDEYSLE
jgi:hypothetical protein